MRINRRFLRVVTGFGVSVAIAVVWPALVSAQSNDPQPQDATTAILAAFDTYDIVGMSAGHNHKKLDDFILSLVRRPELAGKVNDLVVECGNSRYQGVLDRYIAGDPVSLEDAKQAWRDTSVAMCSLSGFYAELFPLVRRLNQALPLEKRLRVLVGEPAVDWSAPAATRTGLDRNVSLSSVIVGEVLSKKHKALVLCGTGHLYHNERGGTAVSRYEQTHPGRTFVIQTHDGFAAFIDLDRGRQLEARMRTWPIPSLVPIRGTWLADLDLPYFMWPFPKRYAGEALATFADAYLYLGPGDSLTWEKVPDSILDDQVYMAELSRRFGMNADALRKRNADPRLFTAADRQEALQFAPGARFVGVYGTTTAGAPVVEIDFREGKLSAKLPRSTTWAPLATEGGPTRYRGEPPTQDLSIEFETVAGSATGLSLDSGAGQPRMKLVRIR